MDGLLLCLLLIIVIKFHLRNGIIIHKSKQKKEIQQQSFQLLMKQMYQKNGEKIMLINYQNKINYIYKIIVMSMILNIVKVLHHNLIVIKIREQQPCIQLIKELFHLKSGSMIVNYKINLIVQLLCFQQQMVLFHQKNGIIVLVYKLVMEELQL